jgi:arsenate reductase
MTITIYHNPNCGTSRNVLAMIRQSGEEPVVIEYLKTPPTRGRLKELIAAMGIPVRALLREKGTPYAELGLGDPKWTDDELLDFMLAHPILINRPIVETPKGVRLCRPSEKSARPPSQSQHWPVREGGWGSRWGKPQNRRARCDDPPFRQ